jgi:hypothetical protein
VSEESHAVRWFPLEDVARMNDSPSVLRMVDKARQMTV